MLRTIDIVTKSLRSKYYTLSACRGDGAVNEEKHTASPDLYQCEIGQKYISTTADIVQYPHFEAGVAKIQKGFEN